jgi:TrmH family RNA methyltransferase
MLSQNKAKFIRSLQHKKYRQKYYKFTVEGLKLCNEILREQLVPIEEIFATSQWYDVNGGHVPQSVECHTLKPDEFKKISNLKTPQEVIFCCTLLKPSLDFSFVSRGWCLFLDGIRNPGNLGTIFRIADWFGVEAVYLSPDCADHYNPKVVQASMASLFRIPVMVVHEKPDALSNLTDIPIWAAVTEGTDIFTLTIPRSGLLVIGNEGTGISPILLSKSDKKVSIPSYLSKGAKSLNAAVAASVLLSRIRFC